MRDEKESIRIANCSGFMGDRFSAAKEMVDGGPIDVLSGDYLAEITMAGLKFFQEARDDPADGGFANNFLFQAQQVMSDCLAKNIKIVVNAGGINPKGLADALKKFASDSQLDVKIAHIEGDNVLPRLAELAAAGEELINTETGQLLAQCEREIKTANAYLGGWGIKAALDAGADIVIAPRTTDAALVLGSAAWKFQWARDDYDALAGAIAAGHIIECGPQVCGGNYSFFEEVPSFADIGFPIAEMYQDGSFTICKHDNTGGLISAGTVTEQILYETNSPAYLNPDVIAHFDTLRLEDLGGDRVYVSGARGSAPPPTHKVCINTFGGYKSTFTIPLAGPKASQKARVLVDEWLRLVGGIEGFDRVKEELVHAHYHAARSQEESFSYLRFTVMSTDKDKVDFAFSGKEFDLVLSNIPGFIPAFSHGMSDVGVGFTVHWPSLVDSKHIIERVYIDEQLIEVLPSSQLNLPASEYRPEPARIVDAYSSGKAGKYSSLELGEVFGTRSGDKGGNANLGVWARDDRAYEYLKYYLTVEKLRELLPDIRALKVERFEFEGIRAVNFFIHGYLENGADSSAKIDGFAKSLGQYAAGKLIEVPSSILP